MKLVLRILVPILILAGGWFGYKLIAVKDEPPKRPPRPERVIRTEVVELRRHDFQTIIRSHGVARPHTQAMLTSQVSGKVEEISEALHDGSFFKENDVLLKIDTEDFEAAVVAAEATLAQAEANFTQEDAKAKQARLNWEDLGYEEEPNDLVLRLPQLRQAEASVKSAKAALAKSKRDLERTSVRAPFTGRVLRRMVSVGQSVTSSSELADIFSTEFIEVRLPITARDLQFLELPESIEEPSTPVILRDALTPESEAFWKADIVGVEGALDPDSRELFAIAHVQDPFSRRPENSGNPRLRIGLPVVAEIDGRILSDVHVIPRLAVRELSQVNLIDREDLTLSRIEIEAVWSDEEILVVAGASIEDGSLLSISRLIYAPDGAKVEIIPSADEEKVAELPEPTLEAKPEGVQPQDS
ncbi:MAG: efflux RND transporter periplasmic adaptor subunit [Verrucomicrobiota bacterium]